MTLAIFHRACQRVYDHRAEKSLNYAVGYAAAGLSLTDTEECRVQCLYILNNISYWRGALAKECREDFRRLSLPSSWE
jgi:hypothetical protein